MSGIVNVGTPAFTATSAAATFDPSFTAVTTSLASILAADANCTKLFIFNPSDSAGIVRFVFADGSDTPTANQCFALLPGMGWIEEGIIHSANKAIYAIASAATNVLIWKWVK